MGQGHPTNLPSKPLTNTHENYKETSVADASEKQLCHSDSTQTDLRQEERPGGSRGGAKLRECAAHERDVGTSGSVPGIPLSPGCRLACSCPLKRMVGVGKQSGAAGRCVRVVIMKPQRS